jgi:hypothetical protein
MRYVSIVSYAILLLLTAYNNAKAPNAANFKEAIDAYLMKHGEACEVIGRQFPIDVTRPEKSEEYGIGTKLEALEQAGLVHFRETTAVVHGMLDPLRRSAPAQPVKRYELTDVGKKYFREIPGALGHTSGFCYGQISVDAIVKWTERVNVGASSQTEVTYTYEIVDAAAWSKNQAVQREFPDIRTTVNGASKATEVVGLQLTSKGWEVPAP